MATGYLRERNGRFYVRTCVRVTDPRTGLSRWKHIERAAGTSRRKALEMVQNVRQQTRDGRYLPCATTVLQLGNMWLEQHVQPNLKPGAAANYKGTFYRHVAPELGMLRVDDCTPARVLALLDNKRAEGLSEPSVDKIRRHIHAMFAFAQDARLVAANPADGTRRPGPGRSRAPTPERGPSRAPTPGDGRSPARAPGRNGSRKRPRGTELSPAQIERFLAACSPRWRPFFLLALETGMRRGELIGLRWGDVDLTGRTILVQRSIGQYDPREDDGAPGPLRVVKPTVNGNRSRSAVKFRERPSTKTDASQRLVPILDGAQTALEELHTSALDTRQTAPVFATVRQRIEDNGTLSTSIRPLCPRHVSRMFRRFADHAGLPSTVRLHDLRHTAITGAISQGEDILLVSAIAGHAKTSTTVDIYGHLMPARVREAAQRMRSIAV